MRIHKKVTLRRIIAAVLPVVPQPGEEACHGSNGTLDNSLPNLAWGSRAINLADRQYRRWGYLSSYARHIRSTRKELNQ